LISELRNPIFSLSYQSKIQNPKSKIEMTSWKIKLLYDGQCPLCLREVNFLQKWDAGRGLIAFVDIADDNYTPEENGGIDFETAMGRIHALLPDGTIVKDLEVFRRTYAILGLGWIYAATQWPVIGPLANKLYEIWADWRLRLTGRPDLATIVRKRQQRLNTKVTGRCRL
jgi:predicted DCC family thiol-disulfide oxidoreductase YuxK